MPNREPRENNIIFSPSQVETRHDTTRHCPKSRHSIPAQQIGSDASTLSMAEFPK
jgi:hypothetical protein